MRQVTLPNQEIELSCICVLRVFCHCSYANATAKENGQRMNYKTLHRN